MLKLLKKTTKHFLTSQGMQFAASLSYSTLLSTVPITILVFFISTQIDFFASMYDQFREQLLAQLLPTSREQIESYMVNITQNIKSFSYLNIAITFLSALLLSLGIERTFNHLWHVDTPRKLFHRIPAHIILWLFAPLFILASLALSTWMTSMTYFTDIAHQVSFVSKFLPLSVSSAGLFLLYYFVPNTPVSFRAASIAALCAGTFFELSKALFTIFITKYAMYEKFYGALATLPIFMLWVYISWVVVLFGASLSVSLQNKGQ